VSDLGIKGKEAENIIPIDRKKPPISSTRDSLWECIKALVNVNKKYKLENERLRSDLETSLSALDDDTKIINSLTDIVKLGVAATETNYGSRSAVDEFNKAILSLADNSGKYIWNDK